MVFYKIKPIRIQLEASSVCQLRCPSCPTTTGHTKEAIGYGILKFDNFRKLLDDCPWIKEIELSNFGEMFLNPDLLKIMELAHGRGVSLTADNGVNFNSVEDAVLEGMVKFQFKSLVVSLDGTTPESYSKYRVKGNFETAMRNIRKLMEIKDKYHSTYPELIWQFIVFGHNEHEIPEAKKLAKDLGMALKFKLSRDECFSPIKDKEFVKRELGVSYTSRKEYFDQFKIDYTHRTCYHLWTCPTVNWDGKLLGCCKNFWGDFGEDAFAEGLLASVNNEKMNYAREMLQGKKVERKDIPCATCDIYLNMKAQEKWIPFDKIMAERFKERIRFNPNWRKVRNTFIGKTLKTIAKELYSGFR
jgi:MoaA/NifB/PqqE/SkfB family radical SAM enzyme